MNMETVHPTAYAGQFSDACQWMTQGKEENSKERRVQWSETNVTRFNYVEDEEKRPLSASSAGCCCCCCDAVPQDTACAVLLSASHSLLATLVGAMNQFTYSAANCDVNVKRMNCVERLLRRPDLIHLHLPIHRVKWRHGVYGHDTIAILWV